MREAFALRILIFILLLWKSFQEYSKRFLRKFCESLQSNSRKILLKGIVHPSG